MRLRAFGIIILYFQAATALHLEEEMELLSKISIKAALIGVLGALVLVLVVVSVQKLRLANADYVEAQRLQIANDLADHIISAAGFQAIERGVTATALSKHSVADAAFIAKIEKLRMKGDKEFAETEEHISEVMVIDPTNESLTFAAGTLKAARQSALKARKRVDINLRRVEKDLTPQEWIGTMSAMIEAGAELRLAAVTSPAQQHTFHEIARMNIFHKHSIWLASEYAGRERAIIGGHINAGKPFSQETRAKLGAFRAINEINVKNIISLKKQAGTAGNVLKSVSDLENNFLGSFEDVRSAVYAASETGEYPIAAGEWIKDATNGIDSILAVSTALSEFAKLELDEAVAGIEHERLMALTTLVITGILAFLSFLVVKFRVLKPMHNLRKINEIIGRVDETGDLSLTIDCKGNDETGQIAQSFNKMISKFYKIVIEMKTSSDHLASASEQLSCTATGIANGAEQQTAKAEQVAAASQEMSCTIVEVAKNASGATEAANHANTAASEGTEVVSKTIQSMNGIAITARESSEVISTLGDRSNEIGKIIKVIEDIADQTNLLALNAAIEAARAGEQGRGFAVVADEVRKLAERTGTATKEIGEMIKAIQVETGKAIATMDKEVKVVEEGVGLAEQAGISLREIAEEVSTVTAVIQQIATASEEQSVAADQISGDIEQVALITREAAGSSNEVVQASQEMAQLALNLQKAVNVFRLASRDSSTTLGNGDTSTKEEERMLGNG